MRAVLTAVAALAVCLVPGGVLRAGLYNTAEPLLFPVTWNFNQFRSTLGDLRGAAVDRPGASNPLREHYLKQVAALEAKGRSGGLTVTDRVNLGAYYLRLLRAEEAARVLEAGLAEEPANFMVLANLATANYLAGPQDAARLSRAIEYQQEALKAWPNVQAGVTAEQLVWNRRAERQFLTLLQLRQQEARLQAGRGAETLDALFPVRFVGPGGRYEAGTMAPDQMDKLPLERVPLVTQLLLWLPFDNRLYWMMAELLNAQGDLEGASAIMNELVDSRAYRPPDLWAHRQVLRQAWEEARPVLEVLNGDQGPAVKAQLTWMLRPRGLIMVPGAGALADEAGWAAVLASLNPPVPPKRADTAWMPDWRPFLVGLVTGAVVVLLLGQQLRQTWARKGAKAVG